MAKSPNNETRNRVALAGVKASGSDVLIHLNRQFLTKALRFGLTRIEITDPLTPLRSSNGGRQMVVMPIRATPAASTQTPRDQSAPVTSTTTPTRQAEQPERKPMPENSSTNGATCSTSTPM